MRDSGPAPPWAPVAGELVAERFDLEQEIARGSMGAIWRAHHVRLDCPVAVKFIDARYAHSSLLRDRFQREARTAARLRSRHVVQILDYGVYEELPYIAMELLEGENLGQRLEREGRLGVGETLAWVRGAARALSKASALGIVHRDIKPENLFIAVEDGEEDLKILDFGVAKLRDASLLEEAGVTKPGILLGTPYYMSREQVEETEVDSRSDLWSLAVIAYECLTGEVPFDGGDIGAITIAIVEGEARPANAIDPAIPAAFDAWFAKATAADPSDRFPTAVAFYEALHDALVDPEASVSMPQRAVFSSAAPDSLTPLPSEHPDPLSWSGPHASARPESSEPPPGSRRELEAPVSSPSARPPAAVEAERIPRRWLVAGVAAALSFGTAAAWSSVAPRPKMARAGAMTRPLVLQMGPVAEEQAPEEPASPATSSSALATARPSATVAPRSHEPKAP